VARPQSTLTFCATVDVPLPFRTLQGGQGGVGRERAYLQDINVRQRDDAGDALQSGPILLVRSTRWSWLKAWAMQIARRRGMSKAIVALARRLAVIIHRISVEI
jgi:transposase